MQITVGQSSCGFRELSAGCRAAVGRDNMTSPEPRREADRDKRKSRRRQPLVTACPPAATAGAPKLTGLFGLPQHPFRQGAQSPAGRICRWIPPSEQLLHHAFRATRTRPGLWTDYCALQHITSTEVRSGKPSTPEQDHGRDHHLLKDSTPNSYEEQSIQSADTAICQDSSPNKPVPGASAGRLSAKRQDTGQGVGAGHAG